jgi:hypothetical protein
MDVFYFFEASSPSPSSSPLFSVGVHRINGMLARQFHPKPTRLPRHPILSRSFAIPSSSSTTPLPSTTDSSRVPPYEKLLAKYAEIKKIVNRPLSLAEKILYSHLVDARDAAQVKNGRGEAYLKLSPDRVAMQGKCGIVHLFLELESYHGMKEAWRLVRLPKKKGESIRGIFADCFFCLFFSK